MSFFHSCHLNNTCLVRVGRQYAEETHFTVDEEAYLGLYAVTGKRQINQFTEAMVNPHVIGLDLETGYRLMATDKNSESEALYGWKRLSEMLLMKRGDVCR